MRPATGEAFALVIPHVSTAAMSVFLNGEIFYSLAEARIVIENWRQHYNTKRPHSSLSYHRPAAPAVMPWPQAPPQPASPATSNVADKPTMH